MKTFIITITKAISITITITTTITATTTIMITITIAATCVTWKEAFTILCSFSFVACKYLKKNELLRTAWPRAIGFFDLKKLF